MSGSRNQAGIGGVQALVGGHSSTIHCLDLSQEPGIPAVSKSFKCSSSQVGSVFYSFPFFHHLGLEMSNRMPCHASSQSPKAMLIQTSSASFFRYWVTWEIESTRPSGPTQILGMDTQVGSLCLLPFALMYCIGDTRPDLPVILGCTAPLPSCSSTSGGQSCLETYVNMSWSALFASRTSSPADRWVVAASVHAVPTLVTHSPGLCHRIIHLWR